MAARGVLSALTQLGAAGTHPAAFLIVFVYALLWLIFEPAGLDWHGVATLATWLMTLFITRVQHRDTQALHAKLDELLHAHEGASNRLTTIDEKEPEDIERHREHARRRD